eukprot:TRINITY_DN613_c0_g1_i1.p1 TRINITY_DN613_c0_g1~~TRINITY_DN613_c0_g1_i1.p1  ORF type:complete len:536 (-),score=88.25 TRINITY_DN613_c0_g1_i1:5263-6870(-)
MQSAQLAADDMPPQQQPPAPPADTEQHNHPRSSPHTDLPATSHQHHTTLHPASEPPQQTIQRPHSSQPSSPLLLDAKPPSPEPAVSSEALTHRQLSPQPQPIIASSAIPTNADIITSSELITSSSPTAHPPLPPTASEIASHALSAATEAATVAVKEELPAFVTNSAAYHHHPPDALKHPPAHTQNAPDPTFAEMAHIESAAILNNVISDDAHNIITSAPQTHQRLVVQDSTANMLHPFQEASDTTPLPAPHAPQQPMHSASDSFHQQPQSSVRDDTHNASAAYGTAHMPPQPHQQMHIETSHGGQPNEAYHQPMVHSHAPIARPTPEIHIPTRITNPVVSAALNGTLPKKPARMPGTKQCPSCHSIIAAALAKCTKCGHVFREKKEKVKRSGKRGKKNCPKCNFENPSACSSCKKCKYVFRLKLIEKYKRMRPRATTETPGAAQAVGASLGLPQVQSSNAPAVTTVPLPAGVASFPAPIAPVLHPGHAVSVIPPFSQHQITIHPHTHNVHSTGMSQVHPIPQHPVQHHQPHQQL